MNINQVATLGMLGAGVYLLYRISQQGSAVYDGYTQTLGRPVTPDALNLFQSSSLGGLFEWIAEQFTTELVTEGMEAEEAERLSLLAAESFRRRRAREDMLETIGESGAF